MQVLRREADALEEMLALHRAQHALLQSLREGARPALEHDGRRQVVLLEG